MRCWRKCNRKLYSIIFAETICIRFAFTTLFSILYETQKSVQLSGLTKGKCQSSTQNESGNNKEQKYQLCINVYEESLHPYGAAPSRLLLASKHSEIATIDPLSVHFKKALRRLIPVVVTVRTDENWKMVESRWSESGNSKSISLFQLTKWKLLSAAVLVARSEAVVALVNHFRALIMKRFPFLFPHRHQFSCCRHAWMVTFLFSLWLSH